LGLPDARDAELFDEGPPLVAIDGLFDSAGAEDRHITITDRNRDSRNSSR
jgi:hypothetical protein